MADLYEDDIVLWSEEQAAALRAAAHSGANLPVDWENVAEEIESLGKSVERELASRIATILIHLLKLRSSSATDPRNGWRETIREQRDEIARLLQETPSRRRTVPAVIADELGRARKRVQQALADYGEQPGVDMDTLTFTDEQVLGDWFPTAS